MSSDGRSSVSALERPTAEARSVSELVALARRGMIRLPRFQRGFRWSAKDVDTYFDSLRRGFPIGSLLLWERPAAEDEIRFGSLVVDAPQAPSALWVVDGQQRLTTLAATLTGHRGLDRRFELYFDLASERFVRRGSRRLAPIDWLPLDLLLDTSRLLDHLIARRAEGLGDEAVERARVLAATIGDYRIPLNIVRTEDEHVLREIFHRMNSAGRRMTAPEVFRALHAAFDRGAAGDLRTLIDDVNDSGFGSLRDDTILRCVLATRGGDVYRDFANEFSSHEDPAEAFAQAAAALRGVFAFLRDDASIPHERALPYNGVLPILTRFFVLHPEPHPRTRNLLRRWLWRGSMAWGRDVGALRKAVQEVSADEQASVERLLGGLPTSPRLEVDLEAVQLNKAATRMNLALLASMHPRDLRDGSPVDVASLLDDDRSAALLEIAPARRALAGRILHPPMDASDLTGLILSATDDSLASHAIPRQAVEALSRGDAAGLVAHREPVLRDRLIEQRRRLAEPDADDHPPLSTLVVADP